MKLTIFDRSHINAFEIMSSFMVLSASVLLGTTNPLLSSCNPASVQRSKSSGFNRVWPSLITEQHVRDE